MAESQNAHLSRKFITGRKSINFGSMLGGLKGGLKGHCAPNRPEMPSLATNISATERAVPHLFISFNSTP